MNKEMELNPKEIVNELNKYIIGQDEAKKQVAIAVRNRIRRKLVDEKLREDIFLSNIIMIGPTGVGKTEIARRLSMILKAPFIKVEATKFTEIGYVGKDVESIIRDLMNIGYDMVFKEMYSQLENEVLQNVENEILSIIFPGFESYEEISRKKFQQMYRDGIMDEREIEISVMENDKPMFDIFAVPGLDTLESFQEFIKDLSPKKTRRKKVKVKNAKEIIKEREINKKIDRDKVIEVAKDRVENFGIVFIDEIDKIIATEKGAGIDVSRSGVQRDLLPIVEGTTVMTKYGSVKTDHILFIAAGAFSNTAVSDLMPELQGRFPVRVELNRLEKNDFVRILKEPHNSILKQYKNLLKVDGIDLEFSDDAIELISSISEDYNQKLEDIGARRLRTIVNKVLEDIMFEGKDYNPKNILIDSNFVKSKIKEISITGDRKKYIL
uniref:ATP-dependent protease ATPase subunit HslU n=1 Tax=candidate division WOR-3 bacterium TaxID=2052148 RepID=A0A7C3J6G2_UNCW3